MKEEKITINLVQEMTLISYYKTLMFDLRLNTKQTPPLRKLTPILNKNFKTKAEAFMYLHELFKRNEMHTYKICDMGDCPDIKTKKIPAESNGRFLLSWNTPNGITTNVVELCKVCEEDMRKADAIIEDMS